MFSCRKKDAASAGGRKVLMLTGIVRDDRYLDHMPGHTHPEHPGRLRTIHEMLDANSPSGLVQIPATPATLEELELVHTPTYVKKVLKTSEQTHTSLSPDTPACSKSYLSAWLAVGGCLRALDALMDRKCQACFCLVRPPGHHALGDRAGGFCFFNNLGIAARYARQKYGLKRILIVDWDIHFGNGFQELFYSDPAVLCFSSHDMLLYPFSGAMEETGGGSGAGYTVNIPLSRSFEDGDILYIYGEILTPIIRRFQPELILVAAGFDGHREDPIGLSRMTSRGYGRLTRLLLQLLPEAGNPPLLLSLEGGYNFRALADSVLEVIGTLAGSTSESSLPEAVSPEAETLVGRVKAIHKSFGVWME
jgi:acetoin utilization deacetylase AcuC-like enzyme